MSMYVPPIAERWMGHPVVGGIEANTEILAFDFAQARMTAF
jgi:hypothetical protein